VRPEGSNVGSNLSDTTNDSSGYLVFFLLASKATWLTYWRARFTREECQAEAKYAS
jgi:hypothetical protein